jgi:uncharacterized protein YycO
VSWNPIAALSRLVSRIARPELIISDFDFFALKPIIKNGDCLVSRVDYQLSNVIEKILTGSFYGHAAIYLNGFVYEASTHGVRKISLAKFCYTKDGIGLCQLPGPDWTEDQCDKMFDFLEAQMGEPYDYSFDWDTDARWYCSKLVYLAWAHAHAKDVEAISVTEELSKRVITPQNIWNSTLKIETYGETQ